jgi:hypothetical protein
MMDYEKSIKDFVSSVKSSNKDAAKKQFESMIYTMTAQMVKEKRSEMAKQLFNKKT